MGLGALVAGLDCEPVELIKPKETVLAMKVIQAKEYGMEVSTLAMLCIKVCR